MSAPRVESATASKTMAPKSLGTQEQEHLWKTAQPPTSRECKQTPKKSTTSGDNLLPQEVVDVAKKKKKKKHSPGRHRSPVGEHAAQPICAS